VRKNDQERIRTSLVVVSTLKISERDRFLVHRSMTVFGFRASKGWEARTMLSGDTEAVISRGILGVAVSARPVGVLFGAGYLAGYKDSRGLLTIMVLEGR